MEIINNKYNNKNLGVYYNFEKDLIFIKIKEFNNNLEKRAKYIIDNSTEEEIETIINRDTSKYISILDKEFGDCSEEELKNIPHERIEEFVNNLTLEELDIIISEYVFRYVEKLIELGRD